MNEVGLREMRQHASGLVRRAEAGERIVVTVSGRPAAVLGPIAPRTWRRWDDVADAFRGAVDPEWVRDQALLDHGPADPWERG